MGPGARAGNELRVADVAPVAVSTWGAKVVAPVRADLWVLLEENQGISSVGFIQYGSAEVRCGCRWMYLLCSVCVYL